uniref:SHC-transforming protein 1-like n=1 Tax=Centroberyx gerrardi TaxID=166262 RepID=UPI003AAB7CB7
MREQTLPRFKAQAGLFPGMLQRTKYSRLRNDSLTSLEDRPQAALPLKGDLCLNSAQLDPRTPSDQGPSTLKGFIPRMANIRLHSPVSLLGLRGQANRLGDRTVDGHIDRPLTRPEWASGPNQRLCSQTSLPVPLTTGHNQTQSALHRTKRPITLHRMASLPWTPRCPVCSHRGGLSCSKTSSAAGDCATVGPEDRVVHHHIKYMGSVEVTQSMRALDFDTRMQVTREAISRLCERTSGAKTAVKHKRPLHKGLSAVLGQSNLQFSGSRIILTVSTDSVTLTTAASLQTIAHHPMQSISFASGGDPDMADYIAYVAKDPVNQRACHILECSQGRASEVINSIGQAFETRFRQLLSHAPSVLPPVPRSAVRISDWSPEETMKDHKDKEDGEVSEQHDYYNEIPGKTPPPGGIEDMRIARGANEQDAGIQRICSSEPVSLYENCSITEETPAPPADTVGSEISAEQCDSQPLSERLIQDLIKEEGWFHGRLGREQAESLLSCSGDFLVRESSSASGQYVLSGMEGATVRHLLLVDPHGQVRTRDQVFLSVGHLVRFHMESQTPIVSGNSELCLRQPILQRH